MAVLRKVDWVLPLPSTAVIVHSKTNLQMRLHFVHVLSSYFVFVSEILLDNDQNSQM